MQIYPLKFKPIYKERVWGGTNLTRLLGRKLPGERIGESWDLACHKNNISRVANGVLAGRTLAELLGNHPLELLGGSFQTDTNFPLLIKIIDANDKLSVQVHPDDDFANKIDKEAGKSEAWYVLDAKNDARIIYGLKSEISKEEFQSAIRAGRIMDCLQEAPVKKGDMIYIPTGQVHALLDGIVVYEVQQNSDTTYRVFDYDRLDSSGKSRQLHQDKALEVIRFGRKADLNFTTDRLECPYFKIRNQRLEDCQYDATDGKFLIYFVISGSGGISFKDGFVSLRRSDTIFIPAALGNFNICGKLDLLRINI